MEGKTNNNSVISIITSTIDISVRCGINVHTSRKHFGETKPHKICAGEWHTGRRMPVGKALPPFTGSVRVGMCSNLYPGTLQTYTSVQVSVCCLGMSTAAVDYQYRCGLSTAAVGYHLSAG